MADLAEEIIRLRRLWVNAQRAPKRYAVESLRGFDKMKPCVQERLRRLNPEGIEEGTIVRGLWRKPTSYRRAKTIVHRGGPPPWRHYIPGGRVWCSIYTGSYFERSIR